jgi:hypothetical protein
VTVAGFAVVSALAGIGFFVACVLLWIFAWRSTGVLFFGSAMFFAGFANSFAFQVLDRLESAGYNVGLWRTPKDLRLYSEYWRMAPERRWSRIPIVAAAVSFAIAVVLLIGTMYFDPFPK